MAKRDAKELWQLYLSDEVEEMEDDQEADDYDVNHTVVLKDEDGRFWQGYYVTNANGDYNSWREGDAEAFDEVEPYEVTTTAYRLKADG